MFGVGTCTGTLTEHRSKMHSTGTCPGNVVVPVVVVVAVVVALVLVGGVMVVWGGRDGCGRWRTIILDERFGRVVLAIEALTWGSTAVFAHRRDEVLVSRFENGNKSKQALLEMRMRKFDVKEGCL